MMKIDPSVLTAVAAIGGSLVGALASLGATFFGQRLQARRERLARELEERTELYGLLIEVAVPLFMDSLEQTVIDPAKMLHLYSVVARIRMVSGENVLRAAEQMGRRLLESYEQPFRDTRAFIMKNLRGSEDLDPLLDFTEACRLERSEILREL